MVNRMDEINSLNISQWKGTQQYRSRSELAKPQGDLKDEIYENYYNRSNTITNAFSTNPNDPDAQFLVGTVLTPVYNREPIFEYIERNAPFLIISNDGTDILYVLIAHKGGEHFNRETPIYPGENQVFKNVYEVRLRSPTAGNAYRVTEYPICCNTNGGTTAAKTAIADWTIGAETTAPGAGTALVTQAVSAGVHGYVYGVHISTQEANSFRLNWTSGGVAKTLLYVFGVSGSIKDEQPIAINAGFPADPSTNITITNITAATAGLLYQAALLFAQF